jgi:hypothetical protein
MEWFLATTPGLARNTTFGWRKRRGKTGFFSNASENALERKGATILAEALRAV